MPPAFNSSALETSRCCCWSVWLMWLLACITNITVNHFGCQSTVEAAAVAEGVSCSERMNQYSKFHNEGVYLALGVISLLKHTP